MAPIGPWTSCTKKRIVWDVLWKYVSVDIFFPSAARGTAHRRLHDVDQAQRCVMAEWAGFPVRAAEPACVGEETESGDVHIAQQQVTDPHRKAGMLREHPCAAVGQPQREQAPAGFDGNHGSSAHAAWCDGNASPSVRRRTQAMCDAVQTRPRTALGWSLRDCPGVCMSNTELAARVLIQRYLRHRKIPRLLHDAAIVMVQSRLETGTL